MESTIIPYNGGIIAPPEIAIINKAEAVFVNFPKPSNVKGHIAGHTKALAIPKAATNSTEVNPVVFKIHTLKIIPKTALDIKAVFCLTYLGIKKQLKYQVLF